MILKGLTGAPIHQGSWGLPDFGVSEWLQGKQSTTPASNINLRSGIQLNPTANVQSQLPGDQTTAKPPVNPALPPATGATTGGQSLIGLGDVPYQSYPNKSDYASDLDITPALQALQQQQQASESEFQNYLQQLEGGQTTQIQHEQNVLSESQKTAESQRLAEGQNYQNLAGETKSQGAEIQRGLSSRYGDQGAGQFISALAARETSRGLNKLMIGYQGNLSKIQDYVRQAETTANERIAQIAQTTTELKDKARSNLQYALANINERMVSLNMTRSEAQNSAFKEYRNTIAEVDKRNQDFAQKIWLQLEANKQKASSQKELTTNGLVSAANSIVKLLQEGSPTSVSTANQLYARYFPQKKDETQQPVGAGAVTNVTTKPVETTNASVVAGDIWGG